MTLPPEWRGLASRLADEPCWSRHLLEWVASTGSTNDDLKAGWAHAPPHRRLRVAGHQTAGRGQRGRGWTAAPEAGLLFSFTWSWECAGTAWEIPLRAGLAMHAACAPFVRDPSRLWLKWPNDLCLGDGKLGGILVESTLRGDGLDLVVGVGINLRRPDAVIDTSDGPALPAAALADEASSSAEAHPWTVLEKFASQWNAWSGADTGPEQLMAAYERAAAPFLGRRVRILAGDGTSLSGRVTGFAGNGELLVVDENGGQRRVGDARRVLLADAVTGPSPES
ncbi:MAG TPA: biotin--[acetyl-CoA-carboxylase] ligase [Candidatus Ozemobacteraceae bacterium]|nr:biotin--[acetyl-CoA-carboxylase] ligase [Candidatus Ozemobacteraceae bacterium]